MKHILKFFACLLISFLAIDISGYRNLLNNISESLAVTSYLGTVFVLTVIIFVIWELYSENKAKIDQLNKRIDELERKNDNKE